MARDTSVIYALCDPFVETICSKDVYYIGQTIDLEQRFMAHLAEARRKPNLDKSKWLNALLEQDVYPVVLVLEETTKDAANVAERKWFEEYWHKGAPLLNLTEPRGAKIWDRVVVKHLSDNQSA